MRTKIGTKICNNKLLKVRTKMRTKISKNLHPWIVSSEKVKFFKN